MLHMELTIDLRATRLQQRRERYRERRDAETDEQKEARLQRERETARLRRQAETHEQREDRRL